ncbi:hypothetical protein COOONC_20113 [Cooperia oncophora]
MGDYLSALVISVLEENERVSQVLFSLICYSQTFYVCIWRSTEYRIAFKEQLWIMLRRKPNLIIQEHQTLNLFTRSVASQDRVL